MKVTDLRRKLIAAFAAGGLLAPSAVQAANLNENLIINPGFENVDINTVHGIQAVKILDWTAGTASGFAYSHNGSLNGAGQVVPDYANGGPLSSGGSFYFTPNASNPEPANASDPPFQPDINLPTQVVQNIDVSVGPSGTLIASGNAVYSLSGFFSSYLNDGDFGTIRAEFLDSSDASLGSVSASTRNLAAWTPAGEGGLIPVGTATVRVSVFGTALSGGPDGYMDNVSFQIGNEIVMPGLELTIDRDDGSMTLSNRTGSAVNIKSYSISSAFEALQPANWKSISDNYDAGNAGPDQVDPVHNWSKLTDPDTHGDLSEADLESGVGGSIGHTKSISLGNANTWIKTPTEDLVFQYIVGSEIKQGIVDFTGHGDVPFAEGDLNTDSIVNSADWMVLRSNQHTDLSGQSLAEAYRLGDLTGDRLNNHADFVAFKNLYDGANGAGSFVAMIASVPEPSTFVFILTAGFVAIAARRRGSDTQ